MGPPQGSAEGEENLPRPAAHTPPHAPQETISTQGTLLAQQQSSAERVTAGLDTQHRDPGPCPGRLLRPTRRQQTGKALRSVTGHRPCSPQPRALRSPRLHGCRASRFASALPPLGARPPRRVLHWRLRRLPSRPRAASFTGDLRADSSVAFHSWGN